MQGGGGGRGKNAPPPRGARTYVAENSSRVAALRRAGNRNPTGKWLAHTHSRMVCGYEWVSERVGACVWMRGVRCVCE